MSITDPHDEPLDHLARRGTFYHVTRSKSAVLESGKLIPLSTLTSRFPGSQPGFGQSGLLRAADYVSLTTSRTRANNYFGVLAVLSGISTGQIDDRIWIEWYLKRWGQPSDIFRRISLRSDQWAEQASNFLISHEIPSIADSDPEEILPLILGSLTHMLPADKAGWLIRLDQELVCDEDSADRGLGIVGVDVTWPHGLSPGEIGLFEVTLREGLLGHHNMVEEEVRVRGELSSLVLLRADAGEIISSLALANQNPNAGTTQ